LRRATRARGETTERAPNDPFPLNEGSRSIVIDFDGTITERDTLELIVHAFGDPEVRRFTEAELGERLTLREVIARQYASVRSPLSEVVDWALATVRFRPGFPELVNLAQERSWRLGVVSSGVREVIEPLLAREGLAELEVLSNSVEPDLSGWRVRFRSETPCEVCGEPCKRGAVRALADGAPVIYIGDGYSDGCAAEAADLVFARRRLVSYLEERGQEFERFDDFFQVVEVLCRRT
jgi:2-hydroxy-3-keto-5-methylthiopentenyl-1-phosphate phosphatase